MSLKTKGGGESRLWKVDSVLVLVAKLSERQETSEQEEDASAKRVVLTHL